MMVTRRLIQSLCNFFIAALIVFIHCVPVGTAFAQTLIPPLPDAKSTDTDVSLLSPDYQDCGTNIAPVVNWEYEQEVVELTNQARASYNLPPLKRVDELDQAARYHSTDLGLDDYFDHDSYDRINSELNFVCLWWARITNFYSSVQAENIAAGYLSPSSVVQGWMDSPGHRQNILSTYNDEIGVGYFEGEGMYNRYWTQDFGNRGDVYPLVIDGEAATTSDRMVSLYVYGDWDEIRLKNNEGTWSNWLPFQNNMNWTLPAENGIHYVTAEMRDATRSTTSSDSITLASQTSEPELGNLPAEVTFTYSIPNHEFFPEASVQIPENISSSEDLFWEVTTSGDWFIVTPTVGATPDAFTILPTQVITNPTITYTGVVTVTANSTLGMLCTPHVMTVNIQVVEDQFSRVFLPLLSKPMP